MKQRRIHICTEEIPVFTKEMRERQKDILKVRNNLKAHPVIVEGTSVTYEEVAEIAPEQLENFHPMQRELSDNHAEEIRKVDFSELPEEDLNSLLQALKDENKKSRVFLPQECNDVIWGDSA